jgi:hypothetical protein
MPIGHLWVLPKDTVILHKHWKMPNASLRALLKD